MKHMRWLRFSGIMLGLAAVLIFLLIAAGLFDPKPVGELTATAVPHTLTIPPQHKNTFWLPEPLPPGNFTVRATITHQSGEPDSGAGLVLSDDCGYLTITISPLGYSALYYTPLFTAHCSPLTERLWQPWPHVRTGSAPNEIWVDVVDGQMRVRMNRELLWADDAPFQPTQVGVYGESWGDTAVFHFQQIELFTDTR
jgi:hypothetical protein